MPVRRISGGLHDFVDSGGVAPLEPKDREAIRQGYQEYTERKRKERKRNIIILLIFAVIFIIAVLKFASLI